MVKSEIQKKELYAILTGFALRVALIILFVPYIYTTWFVPFLTFDSQLGVLSSWSNFLTTGGPSEAFPYGPVYLFVYKPLTFLFYKLAGLQGAYFGLGLTVLILDFVLFWLIRGLLPEKKIIWSSYAYWLSPIIIYCLYWHGQLDVLPVMALVASLAAIKKNKFFLSSILLGLAINAKFAMLVALPFFLIFLFGDKRYFTKIPRFISGLVFVFLSFIPFAFDAGFRKMVYETSEVNKVFDLRYTFSDGYSLYMVPLVLLLLIYLFWKVRRVDINGLTAFVGLPFFTLVLLTPSSPGWLIWILPFLVIQVAFANLSGRLLVAIFSCTIVSFHFLTATGIESSSYINSLLFIHQSSLYERLPSIMISASIMFGLLISFQIYLNNIILNPFYLVTRNPILISISGNSGTGKDTLSDAIKRSLGVRSTVCVSGDDYHRWDRKKPMWRALTHLDPAANDLAKFKRDVLSLKNNRSIRSRHYDHKSGRMTKPKLLHPKNFIISSGLHSLFFPELRDKSELKIFLDMDENLRRELKIERDVNSRGHALEAVEKNIISRRPDSKKYIYPQKDYADICLQLYKDEVRGGCYSLRANFCQKIDPNELARYLLSYGGVEVRQVTLDTGFQQLDIMGEVDSELINELVSRLTPNIKKLLSLSPKFESGSTGLLQICVFLGLEQILFKEGHFEGL